MLISRKVGLVPAILVGLAVMAPALADNATMAAKSNVNQALGTVNNLQEFFTALKQRQDGTATASASGVSATTELAAETMKCPICGMAMTPEVKGGNTHAVMIKGKTWYCCACNMSTIADKAATTPRRRRRNAPPAQQ